MDSFFSLFDPSDGAGNNNNKKKGDAPKGRRKGRKSTSKSETLPEESSFLCEPDLSTELLVKDGSYIESYIEVNRNGKNEADKNKPKRRNSGRKTRRKKSLKISPAKESNCFTAWTDTDAETTTTENTGLNYSETGFPISENEKTGNNWNNRSSKPKFIGNIGKNVNDLSAAREFKNCKRKNSTDFPSASFQQKEVYNVIDKLEKVGLKDDMYLAGDFNTEDLENDVYSSDDVDESFDDSSSEGSGSADECYGSLPPEPRFGNVEYKLQLVSVCEKRFQHLVTQLKWRLRSGGGSAVYVLGVRDCGALHGLRARSLRASLHTLRHMARALRAALTHVTARRVAPHRAVAEVYIRKLADTQQSVELRVAVMGANEAGKSTLIGVLTQGELDNGRGSARLNMFRHLHEVKSGRTSSLSHEILGFDAQGNVVNYGCSELMTAERIGERSAKLVSFLDLAGHSKYQRTTLHGLTGYSPHYAMLVISATAGITRITEEHIGLLLALDLPFFCVISKCELAPNASVLLTERLKDLLLPSGKKPLLITNENLARNCVAPQKLILDTIDIPDDKTDVEQTGVQGSETGYAGTSFCEDLDAEEIGVKIDDTESSKPLVPVFPVSCVRGAGLNALHAYLLALQPPVEDVQPKHEEETCEFQIDEIFHVGESTGPVVGGLLARGQLYEGDNLIIGPLDTGEFVRISVKTIYRNRVPHGSVRAGQSASLGLSEHPPTIRPGMVLLAIPEHYKSIEYEKPTFGGCAPGTCKLKANKTTQNKSGNCSTDNKNNNFRRKNKNFIEDIAIVEKSLVKIDHIEDNNIYKSDSETGGKKVINKQLVNTDLSVDIYDENTDLDEIIVKSHEVPDINGNPYKNDVRKDELTNSDETENEAYVNSVNDDEKPKNIVTKTDQNLSKENRIKTVVTKIKRNMLTCNGENDAYVNDINIDEIPKSVDDDETCKCRDEVLLEDSNDPRGCMYFQASIKVLRHSTAICPGFQCTIHVGNVTQTAIIEGIMSTTHSLRAGQAGSCVFRFARCPEYLVRGRRLLLTAGLGTRAIGRITQIFPHVA